jgi:hypothetical protein
MLHFAAKANNVELVKILVEAKAKIDFKNKVNNCRDFHIL